MNKVGSDHVQSLGSASPSLLLGSSRAPLTCDIASQTGPSEDTSPPDRPSMATAVGRQRTISGSYVRTIIGTTTPVRAFSIQRNQGTRRRR